MDDPDNRAKLPVSKAVMNTQLILLAHGSRDSNWCLTFEQGLKNINKHLEGHASLAYMEMATPGLEAEIAKYYQQGVREFEVLPLFFAAGRHLLHDVPELIAKLHDQFDGVSISLLAEVGKYEAFWEAMGRLIASERSAN